VLVVCAGGGVAAKTEEIQKYLWALDTALMKEVLLAALHKTLTSAAHARGALTSLVDSLRSAWPLCSIPHLFFWCNLHLFLMGDQTCPAYVESWLADAVARSGRRRC